VSLVCRDCNRLRASEDKGKAPIFLRPANCEACGIGLGPTTQYQVDPEDVPIIQGRLKQRREYERQQAHLDTAQGHGLDVMIALFGGKRETQPETDEQLRERIRAVISRAAPALVRALLSVEWCRFIKYADEAPGCPSCASHIGAHRDGCELDAALTLCGLDTGTKRDAVRAMIAKEKTP
jgi:hypothetical protein